MRLRTENSTEKITRVLFWGTYDIGKPRTRILLQGLLENGVEVIECHADVWSGVEDKSQVSNSLARFKLFFKWLLSYPKLLIRYLQLPVHDIVFVGYMGQLDVLIISPFAKLRGVKIVWDAFLCLYDTVVEDRRLVSPRNPIAYLLYVWEWLASRAADLILLDTATHAEFFRQKYNLPLSKTGYVFVGVEPDLFPQADRASITLLEQRPLSVLFYGQFIPLHGIDTIIRTAQLADTTSIEWTIIGKGQEGNKIQAMLDDHPIPNLKWIPWVRYEELVKWIHEADVCLGIFGDTEKAGRVIPNKVFQILASGKPLITRDSPAICELIDPEMPGIFMVPPADPKALLEIIDLVKEMRNILTMQELHKEILDKITPASIGRALVEIIDDHLATSSY